MDSPSAVTRPAERELPTYRAPTANRSARPWQLPLRATRRTRVVLAVFLGGWLAASSAAQGQTVFVDADRLAEIRRRVAAGEEPNASAFAALREQARADLDRQAAVPTRWYVPGFYRDAAGHHQARVALADDANAAYRLALCYAVSGEPRYAAAAARLADAWATGIEEMSRADDSTLCFSYHFPAMIAAAALLEDAPAWTPEYRRRFRLFVRERALPMNTMDRQNNWGNWGLVLVAAAAAYLEDEDLLDEAAARWKEFIELQIADDGHLPHEVHRNEGRRGLWYTHFSLMPQTLAGEILHRNGRNLFDYESPSGRSLRKAYERAADWSLEPETFPFFPAPAAEHLSNPAYTAYFEILHPRWPHAAAAELLRRQRPVRSSHSVVGLTLTHGEPLGP